MTQTLRTGLKCQGCGTELPPVRSNRPPRWCSERCRKRQYAGTCMDCGAPTDGSNGRGPHASKRCLECDAKQAGLRQQERFSAYRELVERLWAEGKTMREICNITGNPSMNFTTLRRRGYNLPHRYSPERVANITRGIRPNLVKARAVLAERQRAA